MIIILNSYSQAQDINLLHRRIEELENKLERQPNILIRDGDLNIANEKINLKIFAQQAALL